MEDVRFMMVECNQLLDELQFQLNRAQKIMRQFAKIHSVFHVSLLKRSVGPFTSS